MSDPINSPRHYKDHPSGTECIEIAEHFNFCLGNAIKYIWRSGKKSPDTLQDLKKARWYLDREIGRLEAERQAVVPAAAERTPMGAALADLARRAGGRP